MTALDGSLPRAFSPSLDPMEPQDRCRLGDASLEMVTGPETSAHIAEKRHVNDQLMWIPEIARLITSRWISLVPSKMV